MTFFSGLTEGADAMTRLVEQPAIRSDIESTAAINKATAEEKTGEEAGRKQYAKTLADLTAKSVADEAKKADVDPLTKATQQAEEGAIWSDTSQMLDLTRQYQKDQTDYDNMLKASGFLQGKDLEQNQNMLEKKRESLAKEKEKMVDLQTQVADARLYQIRKINDPTSLEGARQWEAQQLGKLFEKQVPQGESESDDDYAAKKAQFVKKNDELPKTYDAAGKAQLDNMMTSHGSAKEALALYKLDIQSDRNIVELEKANLLALSRDRIAERMQQARVESDRARYSAQFVSNARMQLESNDRNIKQTQKAVDDFKKQIAPEPTTGFLFKDPNPAYDDYQKQLKDMEDQIADYRSRNQDIMQQASLAGIDMAQMGQLSTTGDYLRTRQASKNTPAPAAKPSPKELSQHDQEALTWAQANPNDPRAKKILDANK